MGVSHSTRGRIGGLTTAALYDGRELTHKARAAYRESFRQGHACAVCPEIVLPSDLSELERARRAAILRRLHFARMGAARKSA